jgi:hypothetical protein
MHAGRQAADNAVLDELHHGVYIVTQKRGEAAAGWNPVGATVVGCLDFAHVNRHYSTSAARGKG